MEVNPTPGRQRNRRADRTAAAPAQVWQQPVPPSQPVQPMPTPGVTRAPQNTPLPLQSRPSAARSAAPVPRSLAQRPVQQTAWQQPAPRPQAARAASTRPEAPAAPQRQTVSEAAQTDTPAKKSALPSWLTTAISLSLILVVGLIAIYYIYQAKITTSENARQTAYKKVLSEYHITLQSGEHRITWQDEIERYADEYNLEPAFVAAIVDTESDFRTDVKSYKNAKGLMQMMPDTAEWIAGKLDDVTYTEDSMYEAERNIRYGCWYLNFLSKRFRGDPVLVACAYHAGQGNVESWLSNPSYSPDGLTISLDRLPPALDDSKQYARRVTTAYAVYQSLLYEDTVPVPVYPDGAGDAAASADHR